MSPREPGPTTPLPPGDDELHALYREGRADDLPSPALDAAILAAGRAAVREAKPAPRRARPWWQAWLAPVSVAAVAVVGLTLSLRIAEDPEYDARERRAAAAPPKVPASQTAPAAGMAPVTEAAPAAFPAAKEERAALADKAAAAKSEAIRPAPVASQPLGGGARPVGASDSASLRRSDAPPGPSEERRGSAREQGAEAAVAQPAPPPAAKAPGRTLEQENRDEADRAGEARWAKPDAPIKLQAAPPRPAPELKKDAAADDSLRDANRFDRRQGSSGEAAKRSRQEAAGAAAPMPAPMPAPMIESREAIEADPARWIESIRRLRATGLDQEAAAELARFRSRHPDVRLPADLAPR